MLLRLHPGQRVVAPFARDAVAPLQQRARRTRRPPPMPVPRMTAKTVPNPAPAPSAASLSARQLASLAMRTGRPRRAARSASSRPPFSQVLFAPRTSPVVGRKAAGDADARPSPRSPSSRSAASTSSPTSATCRRRRAASAPGGAAARARPGPSATTSVLVPPRSMPYSDHAPRKWRKAHRRRKPCRAPAAVLHSAP